jgi:hypothetical protein
LFKAAEILPEYREMNDNSNHWNRYLERGSFTIITAKGDHDTIICRKNLDVILTQVSAILADNELSYDDACNHEHL